VQLATSDVDRVDAPCPALEQDLGKSAGGGADIETGMPFGVKAEMFERGRKLDAAT